MTLCRQASVVAAAVAVLAASTAAASSASAVQYDCLEGYDNWRAWPDEKKAWCCPEAIGDSATSSLRSINKVGCVLPPEILKSAHVAQDDYPNKYASMKQVYGESTTTTTYTTTTSEQVPVGWPECGMLCEMDGRHASCASQTLWASKQYFSDRPGACEDAHRMVRHSCPHCAGCSIEGTHCESPEIVSETSPAPLPSEHSLIPEQVTTSDSSGPKAQAHETSTCAATCSFEGGNASCKDTVHWVTGQNFGGRPNSCETAYLKVLERCSHCSYCSKLDVCGQTTLAPPEALPPTTESFTTTLHIVVSFPTSTWTYTVSNLYDCNNKETCENWAHEQKQWCYWQAGVVCEKAPVTGTTTLLISDASYDCEDLLNSLEAVYTEERTTWCCKYRGLGCLSDLEGVGVKSGQAMAFRKRYDADDPKPTRPTEVPEDMRMQGTHWVAVAAVFGGCAMLVSLLVVGRLRPSIDARAQGYDDVFPEGQEPLGDAEVGDAEIPEHPEAE